jgi:predicted acetyltransferase
MTELVPPDVRWQRSWTACMLEFGDTYPHGSGVDDHTTYDEQGCAAFVAERLRAGDRSVPPREGWVHCTFFWIVDGDEVVGSLALRHELSDWLLEEGGHIGYSIRPSRRREGHASRALALALDRARGLGLDRVLVTCDTDNDASRRTIERNGGVLEDTRNGKLRYWIALGGGIVLDERGTGRADAG